MIKIIPAIDIINGQCVRLSQGNYSQMKIYSNKPVDLALQLVDFGVKHIHLVDLDGAKAGKIINWKILESITSSTTLTVDYGGGIKTDEDLNTILNCGASQITAGSIAVKDKATVVKWLEKHGPERIILGADVKDEQICISGWHESSNLNLFDFIDDYLPYGIKNIISTDIDRDGMFTGPAIDLYIKLIKRYPTLNIIASGGVSTIDDVVALDNAGIQSVIVGKAILENKISLTQVSKYV